MMSDSILIPNGGLASIAEYKDQVIKDYRGNPLIEALPDIWSMEEVLEKLCVYPEYDENERHLDAHYRYHCVQRLFDYFQPWNKHFDIEQRISRVIRKGYMARNPLGPGYASDLQSLYRTVREKDSSFANTRLSSSNASGFTIIGFSGMGKSTAIEKVLALYPQIVMHTQYKGVDLNHYQLTWMKLDCPHDGSIKGLCANFFLEFDKLLGDNTYNKYASGRNTTTDNMIPRMSEIARRHSLGLLVIDEIQHLSVAKSGGSEKMLNFFVNLVNVIGIPVILIGTTKAMSILQGEFRQARRGSGQQGDMIWENMSQGEEWDLLIEGMWEYQWTMKHVPLTKELKDVLYDESQGIVDIAVKLYAMAQMRAIATMKEAISPTILKQVAEDSLQLVRPMLMALKSGDPKQIAKYDDIRPLDIEAFKQKERGSLSINERIREKRIADKQKNVQPDDLYQECVLKLLELKVDINQAKKAVQEVLDRHDKNVEITTVVMEALKIVLVEDTEKSSKPKRASAKNMNALDADDLRSLVSKGRKNKQSAYEALKSGGYIKNPVEEFIKLG